MKTTGLDIYQAGEMTFKLSNCLLLYFFFCQVCHVLSFLEAGNNEAASSCGCDSNKLNRGIDAPVASTSIEATSRAGQLDVSCPLPAPNPMVFVEGGVVTIGTQYPLIPQVSHVLLLVALNVVMIFSHRNAGW